MLEAIIQKLSLLLETECKQSFVFRQFLAAYTSTFPRLIYYFYFFSQSEYKFQDGGQNGGLAKVWLYFKRLNFISSVIAFYISPYASIYAGLSCSIIAELLLMSLLRNVNRDPRSQLVDRLLGYLCPWQCASVQFTVAKNSAMSVWV